MKIILKTAIALSSMFLLSAHAAEGASGPSVFDRVGKAVSRGANAAANGIQRGAKAAAGGVERGVKAAEPGVKRGANATARGVERGAKATANAAGRVGNKAGGSSKSSD